MSQISESLRPILNTLCANGGVIGGDVALWCLLHDQPDVPLIQLGTVEVFVPNDAQLEQFGDMANDQVQITYWPGYGKSNDKLIAQCAISLEHWKVLNPGHLLVRLLDLIELQQRPECKQILSEAVGAVAICLNENQRLIAFEAMNPSHQIRFAHLAKTFEQAHY